MVALNDTAVGLCLTGLDHLIFVVGDVELEAVLVRERHGKDEAGGLCQQETEMKTC